jgi:poly-beta-1,6-N-acetyl-D-glucosamine synthase
MLFKIIVLILLLLYIGFMLYGAVGFLRGKTFEPSTRAGLKTRTCIIICARNEEKNIEACIRSVLEQNFDRSLLELIVVNDASKDNTLQIAQDILQNSGVHFQIISNPTQEGKKRSITKAITLSTSELIITRDADTYTLSTDWLRTIVSFYEETSAGMIIAPIDVEAQNDIVSQLQKFETAALSILTAGYAINHHAFLCNGANLAFAKSLFTEVEGYKKHMHVASGDDVLFLEDVKKKYPEKISYLKQKKAAAITYPVNGLNDLFSQKIRWSKKVNVNPNPLNLFTGATILMVHILSLFFILKAVFVCRISALGLIFISSRLIIDFLLLFLGSAYFNKPVKWLWFLPLSIIYSVYVVLISLLSLVVKPKWK